MTKKPLALLLLAALSLAGCLGATDSDDRDGVDPEDPDPIDDEPVPDPVTISGSAIAFNPLHSLICLRSGLDGEMHQLPSQVEGWRYSFDPAGSFAAYWFSDGEFMEGGSDTGTTPRGATHVEVCKVDPAGPTEYTLTLTHPAHEGPSDEEGTGEE